MKTIVNIAFIPNTAGSMIAQWLCRKMFVLFSIEEPFIALITLVATYILILCERTHTIRGKKE